MSGGKRHGAGRRAIKIGLSELEKLCAMQSTDQEIAAFFGVSVRTIERRKKKPAFAEAMERGRAKGRMSVRRYLFTAAERGNIAAAIFLAKNLLGYRDVTQQELTGKDGGPVEQSYTLVLPRGPAQPPIKVEGVKPSPALPSGKVN